MFTVPLSTKYLAGDFEKTIKLFPPGCDSSKISDYDGVYSEFLVLVHRYKDISNSSDIFYYILPTINIIVIIVVYSSYKL